jgi:S1-C subfamily serine protease
MGPDDAGDDSARDEDDGEETSGPRPVPSERSWFHPAELSSFVATPAVAAPPRPREWTIGLVSALAGVALTVLALVAFGAVGGRNRTTVLPPLISDSAAPFDVNAAGRVADEARASIVAVKATTGATTTLGSGIVFNSTDVMTAAHLLGGATAVVIVTSDGQSFAAKLVGSDPVTDLALLQVPGAHLPYAVLSSSDGPDVAQPVVAVGAQRGGQVWVGTNVVNQRNLMLPAGGTTLVGLVQTGIAAPAETSGGALLDQNARVVGMLTSGPGSAGPGMAVPIGIVRDVETQLSSSGTVTHGWLGVLATEDDDETTGIRVTAVAPDSPAAKAGILPGDVIIRAGGHQITDSGDLAAEWVRRHPNDPLDIDFLRDGRAHDTTAALTNAPAGAPVASP